MEMARNVLLTAASLADRPDFTIGEARVSPATRTITGPNGNTQVEPRVMQVLIVLNDASGTVVTRDTLLDSCWGGVFVGDDSLNRAIAGVRRVASGVAGDSFEIETVPRTGYRLVVRSGGRRFSDSIDGDDKSACRDRLKPYAAALASGRGTGSGGRWDRFLGEPRVPGSR